MLPSVMQLDAWTTDGNASDKARRKRLTIGYGVGAITVAAALTLITITAHGQVFEAEETIDVSLVEPPPTIDEPEPEVQPEPPKPVKKNKSKNRKMSMATPTDIGGTPDEADPNGSNPYDDANLDDAFDGEGGGGAAVAPKKPVVVKKKEVAPPAFVFVSERDHTTQPVPVAQPRPAYPSDAKNEGLEGTVRVQFLVKADGTIGDVRVLSGDSRLSGAVVEAVKRWRYQPATFEGRPVPTWRSASFPFRLKS